MSEELKIYIKITLKDLRNFCFDRHFSGLFVKIYILLFAFLSIVGMGLIIVFFVLTQEAVFLFSVPLIILSFASLVVPFLLVFVCDYYQNRKNYTKSKLINRLELYIFNRNGIESHSQSGKSFIEWKELYKIKEYKSCFLIYLSPYKIYILPRRCFGNQEELELFRDIIRFGVDKKRLKLKKFPVGKVLPDGGDLEDIEKLADITYDNNSDNGNYDNDQNCLVNVEFFLTQKDMIQYNYYLYYTKPVGIIITGIGILLIIINSINMSDKNTLPSGLLFGIFLVVFFPVLFYYKINKAFKKDPHLQKLYRFKMYDNNYIIEHPTGTSNIKWNELVKIKETNKAFLLFITTQICHIIPKEVLDNKELDIIHEIMSKKKKSKDKN